MGKLEADNRRLKRLCLVALVGLLVILVSGQARNTRKVEAEEFLLEEAAGTVKGAAAEEAAVLGAAVVAEDMAAAIASSLQNGVGRE